MVDPGPAGRAAGTAATVAGGAAGPSAGAGGRSLRLVVAEDETTTRSALVALLQMEPDLEVVREAGDGVQALEAASRLSPDVLLCDLEMPHLDGIEVSRRLGEAAAPGGATKVVLLTRHARPGALRRALQARAHGFVTKSTPVQRIADIVRRVADGQRFIDPQIAALALTEEPCPLTPREVDVLRAALPGGTVNDIARELHLAPGTVRNYLSSAMATLNARTRHEAAQIARREDWL
ncbi:response regulator transcription factor [Kineococcus arenarius]|uniref:response regulator transcription factor n=1 Tax=unclassified Kineococcus TaxID=2621656 RepID=UPI003D7D56C3